MAAVTAPQALTDIESLYCGSVFPNPQVFQGCETALCLFSAEWLGQQMEAIYPDGWRFHTADAYEFARHAANQGRAWDVLTMDPWTGQFDKCAQLIDLWTAITRRVIVLGHGNYRLPAPAAPAGWRTLDVIKRSDFKGGVYWYVMVNDA
jgi:hypothetical protein